MTPDAPREFTTGRGIAALFAGLLAAPIAWAIHQQTSYVLVARACDGASTAALHVVTVATLALAASGGALAWRTWTRAGRSWPTAAGGALERARFLAVVGLLGSTLFALAIVAQGIAPLVLPRCG